MATAYRFVSLEPFSRYVVPLGSLSAPIALAASPSLPSIDPKRANRFSYSVICTRTPTRVRSQGSRALSSTWGAGAA